MERVEVGERDDWKQVAKDCDFTFHTIDGERYWDERNAYAFSLDEIENEIEDPTQELMGLCYTAVDRVVSDSRLMSRMAIPHDFHDAIRASWERRDVDLYGRFDLSYGGETPAKMLEFNADTPTSLFEAAYFQWEWLDDCKMRGKLPGTVDQYNSIHERLIEAMKAKWAGQRMYFGGILESEEDLGTLGYLADCAFQAGAEPKLIAMGEIGVDDAGWFTDGEDYRIQNLFKLYPLEDMMREEFGQYLLQPGRTQIIEPLWKAVLSNKGILPVLWEMFEGHPNLLPAYFEDDPKAASLGHHVRKPLLSREGANVTLVAGDVVQSAGGPYGQEGYILQGLCELPRFGDDWAVIGSWVVAGKACGMGIREDVTLITRDTSRFVPHYII